MVIVQFHKNVQQNLENGLFVLIDETKVVPFVQENIQYITIISGAAPDNFIPLTCSENPSSHKKYVKN